MALNIDTLKTRSLTAIIFVAVMLAGLLWNFWSFIILFTIIHFGCWYEFVKLMKKIYADKYFVYCLLGLIYITMPIAMLILIGAETGISDLSMSGSRFAGLGWIAASFSPLIACTIIFSIWINDTMAYIVGSLIGKTPFSKISPKKTWEGTGGGAVLCILVIAAIAYFNHLLLIKDAIIIAAICAIFGTAGDLLESKIKRMANVKDSGAIMPGHGGFLDRFDSLLVAVPFVWVYVKLFI